MSTKHKLKYICFFVFSLHMFPLVGGPFSEGQKGKKADAEIKWWCAWPDVPPSQKCQNIPDELVNALYSVCERKMEKLPMCIKRYIPLFVPLEVLIFWGLSTLALYSGWPGFRSYLCHNQVCGFGQLTSPFRASTSSSIKRGNYNHVWELF